MVSQFDTTSIDERTAVLANSRRRLVLYFLYESGGEVSLDAVSRQVAAAEADFGVQSVDDDAVRRVADTLYMTHLPILIDHRIVEFDYDEGVLRATPKLEDVVEPSDDASNRRRRWSLYYAVPAVALTGAVLAHDFELVRNSLSSGVGAALLGVLALLLLPLSKYGGRALSGE